MAGGKNVYFVEDNRDVSEILAQQLKLLGYTVCGKANNSKEALDHIPKCKPDVVLVDIELDGTYDGIAIGSYLVTKTDIPFIYVTAHDDKTILAQAKQTVPDGFLLKPYDLRQLNAAIQMAQRGG